MVEYDKRKPSKCFSFNFDGPEDENAFKTLIETIEFINMKSWKQKSQHLLLPFDCDFGIHSMKEVYRKMDRFVNFFNKYNYDGIVMEYSNAHNYLKSIHAEVKSWPVLNDQIFNISYGLTYGPKTFSALADSNSEILRQIGLANNKL